MTQYWPACGMPASTGPPAVTSSRCRPHPRAAGITRGSRSPRRTGGRGHRPPPSGHGGPAALRGDGVHLPGRGAAHRRHRGGRGREYADWRASLLTWAECEPLLAGFCEKTGLPATAAVFTERLRRAHLDAAAALDAGYEDNTDLVITENGVPSLKRRRSAGTPAAAENLAAAIARRMPERSLLSIVARTAYWLGWHHHFGPASGSDPKIADPLGRYCLAVFTGGTNLGPYETARHIAGVSARELSMVRNRHIDLNKLNAAIASMVNAFAELDVVKAWGDGTAVAADGT
jgi:Tn3 transposase DDE domain